MPGDPDLWAECRRTNRFVQIGTRFHLHSGNVVIPVAPLRMNLKFHDQAIDLANVELGNPRVHLLNMAPHQPTRVQQQQPRLL